MNRAAMFVVLVVAGMGSVALAQSPPPPPGQVPPPPQTQGEINSMAAKHPTQAERMKPLAAAAQAAPANPTHSKPRHKKPAQHATPESKPKAPPDEQKPKSP